MTPQEQYLAVPEAFSRDEVTIFRLPTLRNLGWVKVKQAQT
jgi:hypothetical protein